MSEINSYTPRIKENVKQEGILNTLKTKRQILTDRKMENHIKVSLTELKKSKNWFDRSKYAWFVKNIARQAAKDFNMRQRFLDLCHMF